MFRNHKIRVAAFVLFLATATKGNVNHDGNVGGGGTAAVLASPTAPGSVSIHSSSLSVEGVHLPDSHVLDGVMLQRNGHGIRSINFFGFEIKAYVAGLYTEVTVNSEEDVLSYLESGSPMIFDCTFLKSVGQGRVTSAWEQQLEYSVTHRYDHYEKDRDRFIGMFGPIKAYGKEMMQLIGDETVVYDQGQRKGSIPGRDFQRAFLSMWFGEKAVADDLKRGLLGELNSNSKMKLAVVEA